MRLYFLWRTYILECCKRWLECCQNCQFSFSRIHTAPCFFCASAQVQATDMNGTRWRILAAASLILLSFWLILSHPGKEATANSLSKPVIDDYKYPKPIPFTIWSILTFANSSADTLIVYLSNQTREAGISDKVEILFATANPSETKGFLRNQLVGRAAGKYVSFIESGDSVSPNYIALVHTRLLRSPDCVELRGTYKETDRGFKYPMPFANSIKYSAFFSGKDGPRSGPPTHLNPMKRSIMESIPFPDDDDTMSWALELAKTGKLVKEESVSAQYYIANR